MKILRFIRTYKWAIILACLGLLLFYWYEVRPIIVYRTCATQSSADSRLLLASKTEIAKGTPQGESYRKLMEKNMYLRSDYESFLNKCLLHYGFHLDEMQPEESGANSSESST